MICRRGCHADTEKETHARIWYGPPVNMIDLSVIFLRASREWLFLVFFPSET